MPIRKRRVKFFDAFLQGVWKDKEVDADEKLALTVLVSSNADTKSAVEAYLENRLQEADEFEAFGSDLAMIDLDNLERFLSIVMEYLPQLLKIILPLFTKTEP